MNRCTRHQSPPSPCFQVTEADVNYSTLNRQRELKSLLRKGGSGGRTLADKTQWEYFPQSTVSTISKKISENNKEIFTNINELSEDIHCYQEDSRYTDKCSYQMINVHGLEQWIASECVCKCSRDRDISTFLEYCLSCDKNMSPEDMKHLQKDWKAKNATEKPMTMKVENIGLEAIITIQCPYCNSSTTIRNTVTKYYGTNYAEKKQGNENCSWYATNVKLVLGTLAAGMGPSDISCLFSFLGLPNLQSFCKTQFKRIEGLIGKYLRKVAADSMDEALDNEVCITQKHKNIIPRDWKTTDEAIGLTVSYDMGWSKRSSGNTYDSLSGHAFFVGVHSRQIIAAKVTSKKCTVCSCAEEKGVEPPDHDCPRNYHGSSKAMEADGALSLVKELDTKSKSKLYVESFVTDDDTSIRAMLSHYNNDSGKRKGKLPDHIPEPKWLADPSHRTRVVARAIFALVKLKLKKSDCRSIDAHRFKRYFGYMLKQSRHGTLEEMLIRSRAVLEHLFNNHEFCDPKWCVPLRRRKKPNDENSTMNGSLFPNESLPDDVEGTSSRVTFYRSKIEDKVLYDQMKGAYQPYITPERCMESLHCHDTQLNEALNSLVAKYAPKNRSYGTTMSLNNRISIVIGIHNLGHYRYWKNVFELICLSMASDQCENLKRNDRKKLMKRKYECRKDVKKKEGECNTKKCMFYYSNR